MGHAGAIRSSALGTRIAAVAPPPFFAVPETVPVTPAAQTWDWSQPESAPRAAGVLKASRAARRTKSTRPTSAPQRRRPGSSCVESGAIEDTPESAPGHQNTSPAHLREAMGWDDAFAGRKRPVMTARVRVGQVGRGCVPTLWSRHGNRAFDRFQDTRLNVLQADHERKIRSFTMYERGGSGDARRISPPACSEHRNLKDQAAGESPGTVLRGRTMASFVRKSPSRWSPGSHS